MSDKQTYEGKHITVCFDATRCIHAGNCVKGLPDVFRANVEGAWIDPDAASADALAALCNTCPSGALSYTRKDGGADEAMPEVNTITIEDDGPLTLHANFTINDEPTGSYRASLCRCGASKNKPWCDGSHTDIDFHDRCSLPPAGPSTLPVGLPLNIQTFTNGPLLLEGPCEIRNAQGEAVIHTERTVLCRCGGSKNRPYCDATHAAIGFKAE